MAPGNLLAAPLVLLVAQQVVAATFTAPCGRTAKWQKTSIDGCIECMANGSCHLCHHTRVAKWSRTGNITAVSGDGHRSRCLSCSEKLPCSHPCTECKCPEHRFAWKRLRSGAGTCPARWTAVQRTLAGGAGGRQRLLCSVVATFPEQSRAGCRLKAMAHSDFL